MSSEPSPNRAPFPDEAAAVQGSDALVGGGAMGSRMRATDWSKTALGPPSIWSQGLRSALSICLESRFPIALYWGPALTLVYNDAWSPILGNKHPWALGRSAREVWPEIWDTIGPMFEQVMSAGEGTYSEDALLPMHRHGYVEECYFNFTFTPVRGAAGVEGVFNAVIETTYRVVSERRNRLLRDLTDAMTRARSAAEACTLAASSLAAGTKDVPFCSIYLAAGAMSSRVDLVASASLPQGGSAPIWPFEAARSSGEVQVVGDLPSRLGFSPPGGAWPEPSPAALIAPLVAAGQTRGFLVLGANPRRAFDDDYRQFVERAAALIAGGVAKANAYEAERQRAEALAVLDRAKTAFFSNVSHELRTPLTLILGPVEDALAASTRALAGENLETVHRNALRLLKLVNSILDFARIEAGRMQACYEPTDLARMTRDLASAFRAAIERGGVRYQITCPPLSEPVFVDRSMWEKIVLNLISNAFKFTFEGSIDVDLALLPDGIELRVSDTGCGIPAPELPRVFERFHRIDGARGRTHEGSGIGLALVKDLVALHGGSIDAESQVGEGSTFRVRIPRGHQHLPQEHVVTAARAPSPTALWAAPFVEEAMRWLPEPFQRASTDAPPARAPHRDGGRILVADDSADMRDYLVRLLETTYEVRTAFDGAQALDLVRAWRPDIILTDVMMPNLDGFGLLRAVRAELSLARTPIIMLSARAGEESRVEGLESGADDYLVKPFSAPELLARVRVHVELARRRRAAESERDRLQSLLKQVPAIVNFVRGPDLVLEFAHPKTIEALHGRDVVGKPLLEAIPEFKDQEYPGLLRKVFETGEPLQGLDKRVLLDDGKGGLRETFWNFIYLPVRDESGRVEGVMTFDVEVTEQLRAKQRLAAATEEAERANRTKDEFLAMLGHELRNPLAPILTALQLMRLRGGESREQAVIERQVGHLVRLVDDLLDVSRITRGKVELKRAPVEIAAAVASGIEMARPLLEQRRQRLEVDLAPEGLSVHGDVNRLGQVMANLLTNAAKYSDPGTTIRVVARREQESIVLAVRDEGVGIPPDMLDRLFDLFYQQPQALDRAKGGLGLGLAIVKSLVELHGGTVAARSAGAGKGSEFTVSLPAIERDEVRPPPDTGLVTPAAGGRATERRLRVLIVDDNVDAADGLAELVMAMGHDVRAAHDPLAALEVAFTFRPELCFLDIGLPVMDGYELAGRLRESQALAPNARMVAVTGYGQDADRRRAMEAGFDEHMVKPVSLDMLSRALRTG